MTRFCARCGREEDEKTRIIGYLCVDCFIKERDIAILPQRIDMIFCPNCGSVKIGDSWLSAEDFRHDLVIPLSIILSSKIKPAREIDEVEIKDILLVERNQRLFAEVRVSGRVEDIELAKTYVIEVDIVKRLCPVCIAQRTKSYEAVIQVRGYPKLSLEKIRDIKRYIEDLPETIRNFISDIEENKWGIDIKVTSRNIALNLANSLIKEYKGFIAGVTDENVRVSASGRFSKKIISLRIFDIKKNNVIEIRGSKYLVDKVDEREIVIRDRNGDREVISFEELIKLLKKK
ncbi:MAG: NMD3-related protein [Sulfolobales archaeon]